VEDKKSGGHVDEVFRVLENKQRHAGSTQRDVVCGDGDEVNATVASTAKEERKTGVDEDSKAEGEDGEHAVMTDNGE